MSSPIRFILAPSTVDAIKRFESAVEHADETKKIDEMRKRLPHIVELHQKSLEQIGKVEGDRITVQGEECVIGDVKLIERLMLRSFKGDKATSAFEALRKFAEDAQNTPEQVALFAQAQFHALRALQEDPNCDPSFKKRDVATPLLDILKEKSIDLNKVYSILKPLIDAQLEACFQEIKGKINIDNYDSWYNPIQAYAMCQSVEDDADPLVKRLASIVEPVRFNVILDRSQVFINLINSLLEAAEKNTVFPDKKPCACDKVALAENLTEEEKGFVERLGNLPILSSVKKRENQLDEVARKFVTVKRLPETASKLEELAFHLMKRENDPNFFEHPIFQDPLVDYYILLLHLEGSISEKEVGTLHIMTASLRDYREKGVNVKTLPLFGPDGTTINPDAFRMIKQTMQNRRNKDVVNDEQLRNWFQLMREKGRPMHHYLLLADHPLDVEAKRKNSEAFDDNYERENYNYILNVVEGREDSNYSVLDSISEDLHVNMLYRPDSEHRIVTSTLAMLSLFEIMGKESDTFHYEEDLARFQYDLGEIEDMKEDHMQGHRVVSLFPSFIPLPHTADRLKVHGADFTIHDFYHCFLFCQIPKEHIHFFMMFGAEIEKYVNETPGLSEDKKILLLQAAYNIYDAEYVSYRQDSSYKTVPEKLKASKDRLTCTNAFQASLAHSFSHPRLLHLNEQRDAVKFALWKIYATTMKKHGRLLGTEQK